MLQTFSEYNAVKVESTIKAKRNTYTIRISKINGLISNTKNSSYSKNMNQLCRWKEFKNY